MKFFFDTNVLVYMFDASAPEKRRTARELFQEHAESGDILLSTQVLQEFYVTTTRKLAQPLQPAKAAQAVATLAELPLVKVDSTLILAAINRSQASKFSFWDSLVIQAALEGSASTLYSEDMKHGQTFDGLTIVNPFL